MRRKESKAIFFRGLVYSGWLSTSQRGQEREKEQFSLKVFLSRQITLTIQRKKPAGLGVVKSVHRFVCNLCSFLLGQEAEIKRTGTDSQEILRLIWRLYLWPQIWKFAFLSFSQSTVDSLRFRDLPRICTSIFKRLLFLHYQVILAATPDFLTGFVFVSCSKVWE